MPSNGTDEEATNTERFIGAIGSLRAVLRDYSEEQRRSSALLAQVVSALERLKEIILEVKHHVAEVRGDVEGVEETVERIRIDTNPRGFAKFDPAEVKPPKNDSGGIVALARLAEKVPASWASGLLKLALSSGLGAALLRAIQWMTTGH